MIPWSTVESVPARDPVALPTKIEGKSIKLNELVDAQVPEAKAGSWYYNKYYLGNGHLQTFLASSSYEKLYKIDYGRRIFRWEDGSEISVDYALANDSDASDKWAPREGLPRLPIRTRYLRPEEVLRLDDPTIETPIVISLHGLTGGSHENYVRATIEQLQAKGFDCAVLNTRGCNRTKLTTPVLFNAAWTEDIRQVIAHITHTQPNRPIYLVGYSLGAAILANYLGQEADNFPKQIAAASIVSAPWALDLCNYTLVNSFFGRNIYCRSMSANLCRVVKNNRAELEHSTVMSQLMKNLDKKLKENGGSINKIDEFDDIMTAPAFGFNSAYDYYRTCSPNQRMRDIRVPSLVLHARDDPIIMDGAFPYLDLESNPNLHTVTTTSGGHLGWFKADGGRWYAEVVAKYFAAFRDNVDVSKREDIPARQPRLFANKFDVAAVISRAEK